MKHSEFSIGLEFWCGSERWRCTDVGTRVIVAISLEPREIVSLEIDSNDKSKRVEMRSVSNDPKDLNGPPFSVPEHVFDEYDVDACTLRQAEGS
ncbi:MAG: hypothetical protein Q8O52_01740 [Sulfuritalea sp.]|nr:hypothetical protein [Sulfuritalea sp.]